VKKGEKTAEAPAAVVVADDAQPVVFPVDFDDWVTTRGTTERHLVAGFRMRLRIDGKLRDMRLPAEWDAAFKTYAYGGEG
jgi:hypothetical protein